jgi:hypothetical protein
MFFATDNVKVNLQSGNLCFVLSFHTEMGSFQNEPILNKSNCGLLGMSLCNLEVSGANLKTEAVFLSKIFVPICQYNPEVHNINLYHLRTSYLMG